MAPEKEVSIPFTVTAAAKKPMTMSPSSRCLTTPSVREEPPREVIAGHVKATARELSAPRCSDSISGSLPSGDAFARLFASFSSSRAQPADEQLVAVK